MTQRGPGAADLEAYEREQEKLHGRDAPTRRLSVEERYHRDPMFRHLVDAFVHAIDQLQLTPTEVREAGIYACIRHEMYALRPHRFLVGAGGAVELPYGVRDEALDRVHEMERWLLLASTAPEPARKGPVADALAALRAWWESEDKGLDTPELARLEAAARALFQRPR